MPQGAGDTSSLESVPFSCKCCPNEPGHPSSPNFDLRREARQFTNSFEFLPRSTQKYAGSAIATREEVFRASLESIGTRHGEPEGVRQPADHIEREADGKRILDLSG